MRHTFALLALASAFAVSAPALAQSTDTTVARCADAPPPEASSRDQTICFMGTDVSGGVVGPYGQRSQVLRPMRGVSLLRIRAHFVPEMMKSVENL
jgi:hypothetical protein